MAEPAPSLRTRAVRALVIALALQALFVFFFVVPSHDPEPNGLPLAVVATPEVAERFEANLRSRGDFDVLAVADTDAARAAVLERDAYGAFVLGRRGVDQVLLASAASLPASQVVRGLAEAAGARDVVDLRPLAPGDRRGITLNLLVLPLIITGILAALVAINLAPDLDSVGRWLLSGASAVGGGLVAVAIANWWLDALPGPWAAEIGVIALAVWAITTVSAGLIRLIGPAGTAVPFLLFLMLGNPASGIASAPELLPSPWSALGWLLPPGALGDALRGTAYFDGAGVTDALVVLVVWLLVGMVLLLAGERRARREAA